MDNIEMNNDHSVIANNPVPSTTPRKSNVLHKLSTSIIFRLEKFFYWYGKTVGQKPLSFIALCLVITTVFSLGILKFTTEDRPFKLWIPQDSDFIKVMEWQMENFPQKYRPHIAIYEAENVLKKEVILELFRIHNEVANTFTEEATWTSTCAKLPKVEGLFGRKKRTVQSSPRTEEFSLIKSERHKRQSWWLSFLTRDDYCSLLENMETECMEHSILEVWGYDNDTLHSLTDEDIINDINQLTRSAVFGITTNFTKFLGGIEKNEEGLIISAKAMKQVWITEIDENEVNKGNYVDDKGTGMTVDPKGFEWETKFIDKVINETSRPEGVNVYLMALSSFGLVSGSAIKDDAKYLGLGFCIVFIYVQIMLGKFNLVEQRPLLSFFGITCVWLSIGVSYGICSYMGILFGPVNNVLPFLLLGLGVDDMFVIIQAWNNLAEEERDNELHIRIGLALKHAGVSITITSLTDFVAFAIGCSTVLPALRSFCLYAAIGILAVYFFQATFFVAWLTLDQRRLENSKQGLCWCIKLKDWTPNKCSQRDLCQSFFKNVYSKYLLKLPSKIFVLFFTAGLLGVSGWGLSNLEQEFNPIWFLPQNSYLFKFFIQLEKYFPSDGDDGVIFFGNVSLFDNIPKINELVKNLEANEYMSEVDSWLAGYKTYWDDEGYDALNIDTNETLFPDQLSQFLHSPTGSRYRFRNFKFDGILNCSDPVPPILVSTIEYKHKRLHGSYSKIRAMEDVKELVKKHEFHRYVQPWARVYSGWETDKIIEIELYRNLAMAMGVVGIMTLALIASVRTSLMVLLCVAMTLVDVGALMHWWGLTIDTVSCIDLVLAVGLCVDYAAHIGHTFMTQTGSKDQRVKDTLTKIGPAVLNGGFSTFLSFVFLAGSDSHVFKSFFKIFLAVCLYGLYHGLVFLPVVLSLIGPASYGTSGVSPSSSNEVELKNGPSGTIKQEDPANSLKEDESVKEELLQKLSAKETEVI